MDGVSYGLNVFNDLNREIRLRWWSEVPDHLKKLDEAVKGAIELFMNVKNKTSV